MKKTEEIGVVTTISEEQIEAWKKKYGHVFSVKVDEHVCYLKKPDRKVLSAAAVLSGKDPIKYNEVMISNCWLGGDMDMQTDDELFMSVSAILSEMIVIKEAEVKEL